MQGFPQKARYINFNYYRDKEKFKKEILHIFNKAHLINFIIVRNRIYFQFIKNSSIMVNSF